MGSLETTQFSPTGAWDSTTGQHLLAVPAAGNEAGTGHQAGTDSSASVVLAGADEHPPKQCLPWAGTGSAPSRLFNGAHAALERQGNRGRESAITQCCLAPGWFCRLTGMQPSETTHHLPKALSLLQSLFLPCWGGQTVFGPDMKTGAAFPTKLSCFVSLPQAAALPTRGIVWIRARKLLGSCPHSGLPGNGTRTR